jgi:hypothetical protein
MILYMNHHFSSTPIQNKLFGYISFLQISFYYFPLISVFGRHLPLLMFLSQLRIPPRTGASEGLHWIWPNHRKWCWTSFSWIGATPIYPIYYHFWFDLSLCGHIFNAISVFQLHSSFRCVVFLYPSILRHTSSRV